METQIFKALIQDPTSAKKYVKNLIEPSYESAEAAADLFFGTNNVLGISSDTSTDISAMKAFAHFQLNYPHNFVEQAFKDTGLVSHIQAKFLYLHSKYGATGAVIMLWAELDVANRDILGNYIINNVKL